jgi:hypothetical protein
MNLLKKCSTFVGHFCPPGSGSGSTDPIESGSTTLIKTLRLMQDLVSPKSTLSAVTFNDSYRGEILQMSLLHDVVLPAKQLAESFENS